MLDSQESRTCCGQAGSQPALPCPHRDQTTEGQGTEPCACLTGGTRDRTLRLFSWRDAGQNPVLIQPEGHGMEPCASCTRGMLGGNPCLSAWRAVPVLFTVRQQLRCRHRPPARRRECDLPRFRSLPGCSDRTAVFILSSVVSGIFLSWLFNSHFYLQTITEVLLVLVRFRCSIFLLCRAVMNVSMSILPRKRSV